MKFKALFVLFNVIVVVSFLFVALMPVFIVGGEYATLFWRDNWPLAGLFVFVLLLLNGYFVANWPLFSRLESQDWDGLIEFLEARVYGKGRISGQNVRVLINTYVVKAKPEQITELERHVRANRPNLVPRFALEFGVSHLLSGDAERMTAYFSDVMGNLSGRRKEWAEWNYAFGLTLNRQAEQSRDILLRLARSAKSSIVRALSLYLLSNFPQHDEEVAGTVEEGTERLRSEFDRQKWRRLLDRRRGELQILALSRIIDECTEWLFESQETNDRE